MQRQRRRPTLRLNRWAAFSLVEMLMVIGIISLLMTIAIVAIGHAIAGSREAATDATIKKVHGLLQDRIQAFDRMDFHQEISQLKRESPGLSNRDAEMVVRKWKFRELFPQRRDELTQNFIRSLPADLQQRLNDQDVGMVANSGSPDEMDSAKLLYLALAHSSVLGPPPIDDGFFSSTEVATDTQGDGLPMFVDSWGRPLRFYRWPTALVRPDYPYPYDPLTIPPIDAAAKARAELLLPKMPVDELAKDPDDPHGKFATWLGSPNFPAWDMGTYHDPDTYHAPLIVSPGRDGVLGLHEPYQVGDRGHLARPTGNDDALTDNISNYRRVGGGN